MIHTKIFIYIGLLLCLLRVPVPGQEVEVYVEPQRVYANEPVRIFGFVKPGKGATHVRLELLKPVSAKQIEERVKAKNNGEFSFTFEGTDENGTWQVRAVKEGPGASKGADTVFVVGSGIFLGELAETLDKDYNTLSRSGWQQFRGILAPYPPFPGKEEMEKQIEELLDYHHQLTSHLNQLDQAADAMEKALERHGHSLPDAAHQALARAAQQSVEASAHIRLQMQEIESILEESREEAEWCYIWLLYYNFCSRLNEVNDFIATSIKDIALNLGTALAVQNMPFPVSQSIQTVIHILTTGSVSVVGFVNYMLGTISGLAVSVYDELLKNCSQFKGEAEGEYRAELLHRGAPFFTMSYRLKGEVVLVFQKRKPGDPAVYLRGYFKGEARDFDCSMTMVPFAVSTFTPAWCRCPVPLLSLRSFNISLEGDVRDDKMRLKQKTVNRDFKLQARGYYVILSVHQPIPLPGTLSFPLMNGSWFLARVTKISNPRIEYFDLPIAVKGDRSTAEKQFERQIYLPPTKDRKGVRVTITLHLKVCQPPCQ
jgi:hypothetical protein